MISINIQTYFSLTHACTINKPPICMCCCTPPCILFHVCFAVQTAECFASLIREQQYHLWWMEQFVYFKQLPGWSGSCELLWSRCWSCSWSCDGSRCGIRQPGIKCMRQVWFGWIGDRYSLVYVICMQCLRATSFRKLCTPKMNSSGTSFRRQRCCLPVHCDVEASQSCMVNILWCCSIDAIAACSW